MKFYFAGAESVTFSKVLKEQGVARTLESAFYLQYKKTPNILKFNDYLLDSGGYTALMSDLDLDIKTYIDFLNKHKIKVAFTLDVRDVQQTVANTYLLKRETNTKIIPVYHDFDFFDIKHRDLLLKYCGDFDFIGLAGLTRKNFTKADRLTFGDWVFHQTKNKIKVHGLAVTTDFFLNRYPFYSVDSTTWLNCEKFGAGVEFKQRGIRHVTSLKTAFNKGLGMRGVENKMFYESRDRMNMSIESFIRNEQFFTDLWAKRGVKWR